MFLYIKRFWKDNFLVGLLLLGSAISQTIASVLNATALNALIAFDFERFFVTALQMFIAYLFFLLFTYLQVVKGNQTIQKMLTSIRGDITSRIEETSYNHFHEKEVGTYASWLSNDMNTIQTSTYQRIYEVASGIIGTITSVIALFFFHWSLVIWSFIVAGITLLLPRIYQTKLNEASLKTTQEEEKFLNKANDVLGGFDTLFSYNLLKKISIDIIEASKRLAKTTDNQARVLGKVAILGALGNVFGQLSILVLTGFLAFQELLSIGSLATTGNLASTIFNTVGNISQQIASIKATQPIFEKFETIKTTKNGKNEKLEQLNDGFQLENVEYSYGDKKIFSEINYSFNLGNKYAVVGASGSGKSTLLNILNGKLPDYAGSVTLSNKELKHLEGRELRNQILYIDQVPYLFEGTIRYNITLGENFTDEQLLKAIQDSDLEDLIHSLPDGLDTSVGEAGRSFSGGQRQRIALARGLVRGKTCILIDEGTSSLDETSALKIEESLINNPKLTVIMITHHLRETIEERLDGILVLS
jgi:ABC-type multidrug transport system fused ATPase/permease subunit